MTNEVTFGEQMRRLRRSKRWSLQQLSDATGLSYSHLSRVENDSAKPKADTVFKICEALDGDLAQMLDLADALPEEILKRMRDREQEGRPGLRRRAGRQAKRPKGEAMALARASGLGDEEIGDAAQLIVDLLELSKRDRALVADLVRGLADQDEERTS